MEMTTQTPYASADPKPSPRRRYLAAIGLGAVVVATAFLAGRASVTIEGTGVAATKFMTQPAGGSRLSRRAAPLKAYNIEEQTGILPPVGFFDPAGISKGKSEARLKFFREAELKHGRVAMLAAVGFLLAEEFHPLFGGDIDTPSYLAFQQTPLEVFWGPVVALLAAVESRSVVTFKNPGDAMWTLKDDHILGDFGFDPLGLKPTDPTEFADKQTKELQNGRLAMLGIAGMVAQELVDGQKLLGGSASAAVTPAEVLSLAKETAAFLSEN